MAVPVEPASTFSAGTPVRLFAGPFFEFLRTLDTSQIVGRTYDISSDGRRFLLIKHATPIVEATRPQIVVVQNWTEELKRIAPVN